MNQPLPKIQKNDIIITDMNQTKLNISAPDEKLFNNIIGNSTMNGNHFITEKNKEMKLYSSVLTTK